MKNGIGIFLVFGLMMGFVCPSVKKQPTEIEQVALTVNELSLYFGATLQFYMALKSFSKKYNTKTPEITCKFCPARSLPCDELIVKVQAKAIDKAIGAKASVASETRKKMLTTYDEITNLISFGSLDDIRGLMAKIAQEEAIPCEGCQRVEWRAIGVSKKSKKTISSKELT